MARPTGARPRVLLAWQHGNNLGHLARLSALGSLVAAQGAEPIWAVPAEHLESPAWQVKSGGAPCLCLPVPRWVVRARSNPIHSFADVLSALGYSDPAIVTRVVRLWMRLFEQLQVDRVIVDYAPAALLAAAWAGLPSLQVTNGFDSPPPQCPPFSIGLRGATLMRRSEQAVARVDACLAAVSRAIGPGRAPTLRALLAYPRRVYDCVPELDPYGPRDDRGAYVGPLGVPHAVERASWLSGPAMAPRVFVYVRDEVPGTAILTALTDAPLGVKARTACFWPGATATTLAAWRGRGVFIADTPLALPDLLPSCDLVVSYGPATLTCQALLAGKPQLLLPADAEKWLIADRLARQGAAVRLPVHADAAAVAAPVQRLLQDPAARNASAEIAARHRDIGGRAGMLVREFLA